MFAVFILYISIKACDSGGLGFWGVMNLYRQLFTRPAYSVKCDNPLCHAHNQTHTTRGGRAMRWFFKEDWSKRRTSYDYDNTVLLVNFTHHERQLVMVSQDLFLF